MAENHKKQCFTFFAFLPAYIGVSGSLVFRKRKISMRSIDWYQKFLISCLAARYSTVFVLRRSKWLKMTKNQVLRFLPFYPLISAFQALSCLANARVKGSIDWYQKFLISRLAARYSAVFVFFIVNIDFLKLNLLSNRAVERFWDALWLGIGPFLCST